MNNMIMNVRIWQVVPMIFLSVCNVSFL